MANYNLTQTGEEVQAYIDSIPVIDVTGTLSGSNIVFATNPYTQIAANYAAECGSVLRLTVAGDVYVIRITGYDSTYYTGSVFKDNQYISVEIGELSAQGMIEDANAVALISITGTSSGGNITLSSNPFMQVQTAVNAGQHVVVRVTIASDIIDFTMNTYSASVATYIGTANFLENEFQLLCSASSAVITNRSTSNTFSTGESVPNVGIDATPTQGSNNLVKSGGVYDAIEGGFFFFIRPYDAEVEYLTFGGAQYIDTGIIPSNTHGILLDVHPLSTTERTYTGSRNSSATTRFTIGATTNFTYGWGDNFTLNDSANNDARHTIGLNYLNSREVTYDSVLKASLGSLGFTPNYPIFVGRYNVAGTPTSSGTSRIYGIKISNGESVIFDGIPVRKDGKGCLYDRVSGTLFENAGTGTITYGNDI